MGKDNSQVVGYHYRIAFWIGLTRTIDAFLEFRAADKVAWNGGRVVYSDSHGGRIKYDGDGNILIGHEIPASGPVLSSQRIQIGAPMLFGGPSDQGGITGPVDIMFGEADQLPNAYLRSVFGEMVTAMRGLTTVAFCGGRYGAMNPMPQKPAFKVRKITAGWDEPGCWYPETAEVEVSSGVLHPWENSDDPRPDNVGFRYRYKTYPWRDDLSAAIADAVDDGDDARAFEHLLGWSQDGIRINRAYPSTPSDEDVLCLHFNPLVVTSPLGYAGDLVGSSSWPDSILVCGPIRIAGLEPGISRFWWARGLIGGQATAPGLYVLCDFAEFPLTEWDVHVNNCVNYPPVEAHFPVASYVPDRVVEVRRIANPLLAMNPAHTLYYVRTDSEKGREPREAINEASLTAAADRLYAEGFGLCWSYDPKTDTPDAFTERICRIIGGSFTRSWIDGEWYLDLARGDYDIDTLPVIDDDDILDFKELPTTLDRAVNSIAVRYFDPERKEKIITPAVRALGLIRMFGEIHETLDMPEIPTGPLALRVAERELRARITPTRTFELVTTPRTRGIRNNQYFVLRSPRRRIAQMVCIMGEQDGGTLASGGLRRKVSQDVYGQPDTTYVEIEHGEDTRPPERPASIVHAHAFEAPYARVLLSLPRAELDALPDDVGYLLGVAAQPSHGIDYSMAVADASGDYMRAGRGNWCPTAVIVEAASRDPAQVAYTLASPQGLDRVDVGYTVLWRGVDGDEVCRVDALDAEALTISFGRGCLDTVPGRHLAGSRIWFVDGSIASTREYTEGEQVNVKMLPRTATQELSIDAATSMPVEFAARQVRPYPPGRVRINGQSVPNYLHGELAVQVAHRDRVLQSDQLVDNEAVSIGPEPGATWTVRYYINNALVETEAGLTAETATPYTPPGDGLCRIEIDAQRDGYDSWQVQVREFAYTTTDAEPWELQGGDLLQTQGGDTIYLMR